MCAVLRMSEWVRLISYLCLCLCVNLLDHQRLRYPGDVEV